MRAKVTRNRQVTIPKPISDQLGIRVGDVLDMEAKDGRLVARKIRSLEELAGAWGEESREVMARVGARWRTWSRERLS